MPKVSVIIPIYNVEAYLEKCLNSIRNQTLQDIEIICVDDGSTDNSGDIIDRFAVEDSRFIPIHRTNAGYGAAMNAGLKRATGEFVGIVESDDFIAEDMYEVLYQYANQYDCDFVKSDAFYYLEPAQYTHRIHSPSVESYYDRVLTGVNRNIFFLFYMNIWTGIYKKSFLERFEIAFHESPGASYQDNGFWMQTMLYADRVMWLNRAFYYYRQDNPQASVKSTDKIMSMTNEYAYLEGLLKERHEEQFLPYCYAQRLIRHHGTFLRIADECKREFCNHMKQDYMAYMPYIKENTWLSEWFMRVIDEPEAVCEEVISKKNEILRQIEESKSIIIYGAGKRGDLVLRFLHNEGAFDKISCLATTKPQEDKRIGIFEVNTIDEVIEKNPDSLVILAVAKGSNAYISMAEHLQQLGVRKWVSASDIEMNYYIV